VTAQIHDITNRKSSGQAGTAAERPWPRRFRSGLAWLDALRSSDPERWAKEVFKKGSTGYRRFVEHAAVDRQIKPAANALAEELNRLELKRR
jgi:hypothetical protein